jgi:predicted ATPase/class 3 adenylate cyclase
VSESFVTLLLTDIEGSTRLWETEADVMTQTLVLHDTICDDVVRRHGGRIIKPRGEGDSLFAVFDVVASALEAAVAIQVALADQRWPTTVPIRIRMAVHVGPADFRDGDYYGPMVNRAARLRAAGHGGQVLVSEDVHASVSGRAPSGAFFTDLGVHRLKDLLRPERIWQLTVGPTGQDFPRISSLDDRSHNLPIEPSTFVGREEDVAEVCERVREHRLVTLIGPGGVGKTRLAVRVGAETIDAFPDGVWLTELATLSDASLVGHHVAAVLGLREQQGRPMVDTIADHLRRKRALLILDNCEHVVDAAAQLVHAVLCECSELKVLTTSREALHVDGEVVVALAPLELPDGRGSLSESERLFCDRARLVDRTFVHRDDNASAIAQICQRVEGLPLAIELAASRVRMMRPAEIAERLGDRLKLLAGGPRTRDARQQSLAATISWSYDLLTERERVLFERISVLPGGCIIPVAEAIGRGLESPDVLDVLGSLVDKSLVQADTSDDLTRYRMFEAIREYAMTALRSRGGEDAVYAAWADWFIELVADPADRLPRLGSGMDLHSVLESEIDNLRAVFPRLDGDRAIGVAMGLSDFFESRGSIKELRAIISDALERNDVRDERRVRVLCSASRLARFQLEIDEARRLSSEARTLAESLDDIECRALTLDEAGSTEFFAGGHDEAIALFEQVLELPVTPVHISSRLHLADVFARAGRHDEAVHLLEDVLAETESPVLRAQAQFQLAHVCVSEKDTQRALSLLVPCVEVLRTQGSRRMFGLALHLLCTCEIFEGDVEAAERSALESLSVSLAAADDRAVGDALSILAAICVATGRIDEARERIAELVSAVRSGNAMLDRAFLMVWCVAALAAVGRYDDSALLWAATGATILPDDPRFRSDGIFREEMIERVGEERLDALLRLGQTKSVEEILGFAPPSA